MNRYLIVIAVVALGLPIAGRAQDGPAAVEIGWETLATEGELFHDPFAKCSQQQLQQISNVMRVRWLISEEKLSANSEDAINAGKVARRLEKEGVDIDWLMAQRRVIRKVRAQQIETHAASVTKKFQGQQVTLGGFVVPIRANEKRVSEFFLVASIEACKCSAPPSTQVVYVQSSAGIEIESRMTALQVTGNLEQRTTRKTFQYPGKALNFEAEYVIDPIRIEVIELRKTRESGS